MLSNKIVLAFSLLMPASVLSFSLPTKDSVMYHSVQFLAGALMGITADECTNFFIIKTALSRSVQGDVADAEFIMKYASALHVPDALDQSKLLKPYVKEGSKETGRWAYFLGMFTNRSIKRLLLRI